MNNEERRAQIDDLSNEDGGPNQQSSIAVIRQQAERMGPQFHAALPAHIPVERFLRVAMTAIQNNPDLIASDRQSLWNALMRSAHDGLLPDGREGAIVVYSTRVKGTGGGKDHWIKRAQWMPMVFGILKKIRNSGEITTITARVVFGGDKFRYWIDDDGEHVLYEPADNPDTNVVVRVFAMAKTKNGELYVEPMTSSDVEKVRAASRAAGSGPWVDWWEEMAKKTAIRRLSKRLPMSTDLDDLVRRDDELYNFGRSNEQIVNDQKKVIQTRQTLESFAAAPTAQIERHDTETGEIAKGDKEMAGQCSGWHPQNMERGGIADAAAAAPNTNEEKALATLAEDDKVLMEAAKRGQHALDEAFDAIPEPRRSEHEVAMARRHRHAAAEADASRTQLALQTGRR